VSQSLPHIIILLLLLATTSGFGQLSPGDLSQAHAKLEGMSNCTQCHDLGKKVNNNKCLECHKEIKTLIGQKKGYHSSAEATNKDCFACHSEHHGRKFDMIRFDEKKFNHDLTKYKLEGAHARVECKECHNPDNIQDASIRKKKDTFLGLKQECLTCHADYHQKTLSNNCVSCHDMKAFKPAAKFNHDDADYRLTGKHIGVDCIECHKVSTKNGTKFQEFSNVPHNDCIACHTDPHNKRFQGKCTQCHTERSFAELIGKNRFDHNTTDFELKGKHRSVDCINCHKNTSNPATAFSFSSKVAETQCVACHKDVHSGRMGNDCAKCHTENSFVAVKSMTAFNHKTTDFPLEGKHIGVDCKLCHKGKYTDPINFSACKNCHKDYHQGEFAKNGVSPDCVTCHSVNAGFNQSTYSVDQHQKTQFPLSGAHSATPCFSCHVSEDRWTFKNKGTSCTQCHKNVHGERFAVKGITNCERCHDTETWFPSKFDHNLTAFPLDGRHAAVECRLCHKPYEKDGKILVEYKIAKFTCIDCHL
jgi:hypothetical protein